MKITENVRKLQSEKFRISDLHGCRMRRRFLFRHRIFCHLFKASRIILFRSICRRYFSVLPGNAGRLQNEIEMNNEDFPLAPAE